MPPGDESITIEKRKRRSLVVDKGTRIPGTNGVFSVHSAYNFLFMQRLAMQDHPESSGGAEKIKKCWKAIWKLKIKQKIKLFLWKCLRNSVPVNTLLVKRKVKEDVTCEVCGMMEEDLDHFLFRCIRAQHVWKLFPVRWLAFDGDKDALWRWWLCICNGKKMEHGKERIEMTVMIFWSLWKARNRWCFDKRMIAAQDIVTGALSEYEEFCDV